MTVLDYEPRSSGATRRNVGAWLLDCCTYLCSVVAVLVGVFGLIFSIGTAFDLGIVGIFWLIANALFLIGTWKYVLADPPRRKAAVIVLSSAVCCFAATLIFVDRLESSGNSAVASMTNAGLPPLNDMMEGLARDIACSEAWDLSAFVGALSVVLIVLVMARAMSDRRADEAPRATPVATSRA